MVISDRLHIDAHLAQIDESHRGFIFGPVQETFTQSLDSVGQQASDNSAVQGLNLDLLHTAGGGDNYTQLLTHYQRCHNSSIWRRDLRLKLQQLACDVLVARITTTRRTTRTRHVRPPFAMKA